MDSCSNSSKSLEFFKAWDIDILLDPSISFMLMNLISTS